jgi:hypothetical protein
MKFTPTMHSGKGAEEKRGRGELPFVAFLKFPFSPFLLFPFSLTHSE